MAQWWHKAFKTGIYPLDFLSKTPGWKQRTKMEAAFALRALNARGGKRLLDVCCGTGRHAVEMARHCRVTGIDISPYYLKKAAQHAKERGVSLKLLNRDARAMGFKTEFEAAANIFTSFGYFAKPSDDLRMLKSIHTALTPGGLLLLDTVNGKRLLSGFIKQKRKTEVGGGLILLEESRLIKKNIMRTRWSVLKNGQGQTMISDIRIYTAEKLQVLFKKAGFETIKMFGEMNGAPYRPLRSPRLILLAQKPL